MNGRRLAILFGALALLLVWFIWWLLPSGVRTANIKRLREGMTVEEVSAVFGKPPDYADPLPDDKMRYTWADDGLHIRITFVRGRLLEAETGETNFPNFRVRVREWLGWY